MVEISNFGNSDAIWYDFSVLDENFNLIQEHFENYLSQNESKNISLILEQNLSNFYVILDYNNNILENFKFNNILSWPINLSEICNDNLDNNRNGLTDENCILELFVEQNNETNLSNINNSNLVENISNNTNLTLSNLEYSSFGGGSGGGGSNNLNTDLKNSINLNDIANQEQKEFLEDEELVFNFDDFQTKIKVLEIDLENIKINYNNEILILNKDESISFDYKNKSIIVKYIGNELGKALFISEFENEVDEFEIKTKLEEKLNLNLKENISNEDGNEKLENYDSLNNIINSSSNLYNSSNFYYLNNSTGVLNENSISTLKYYTILFTIILFVIGFVIFLK